MKKRTARSELSVFAQAKTESCADLVKFYNSRLK